MNLTRLIDAMRETDGCVYLYGVLVTSGPNPETWNYNSGAKDWIAVECFQTENLKSLYGCVSVVLGKNLIALFPEMVLRLLWYTDLRKHFTDCYVFFQRYFGQK